MPTLVAPTPKAETDRSAGTEPAHHHECNAMTTQDKGAARSVAELEMQNAALRQELTALEQAHDRYLDLYEFAPVGYLTLSAEGIIEEINLTGATLLGRERTALLQHCFSACVAPTDRDAWMRQFDSVKRHAAPRSVELALQRGDGSEFPAQLECAPQKVLRGAITGGGSDRAALRLVLFDISERKQNETVLRQEINANRRAEQALQQREQ